MSHTQKIKEIFEEIPVVKDGEMAVPMTRADIEHFISAMVYYVEEAVDEAHTRGQESMHPY